MLKHLKITILIAVLVAALVPVSVKASVNVSDDMLVFASISYFALYSFSDPQDLARAFSHLMECCCATNFLEFVNGSGLDSFVTDDLGRRFLNIDFDTFALIHDSVLTLVSSHIFDFNSDFTKAFLYFGSHIIELNITFPQYLFNPGGFFRFIEGLNYGGDLFIFVPYNFMDLSRVYFRDMVFRYDDLDFPPQVDDNDNGDNDSDGNGSNGDSDNGGSWGWDGILDFIIHIFIPRENFWEYQFDRLDGRLREKLPFQTYIDTIGRLREVSYRLDGDFTVFDIKFEYGDQQHQIQISHILAPYLQIIRNIVTGLYLLVLIRYNLHQIQYLLRGNASFSYAGKRMGLE